MLKLSDLALRPDFQFGPILVSPPRRFVEGPGGHAHLQPLIMQVLLMLLDARGQVVTRNHLFDQCWGGAHIGDNSLDRAIAKLRQIAANVAPGLIEFETIPRTGYRMTGRLFLAENLARSKYQRTSVVDVDGQGAASPRWVTRRTAIAGGASVLVALGGAGAWRARREVRSAEMRRLTDRGDVLLRDSVPIEAGAALPPLRASLEIDPSNATTLGLFALAEETRAFNGGSSNAGESLQAAEQAARAALQREPDEPHARLAMIDMKSGSLDWAQIEDRLESVRAFAPTNPHVLGSLTTLLQGLGRTSRSWLYNEQAAAAAPASPTPQWRRALRLWTAGHTEEALSLSERLQPLWPAHVFVWNTRFMILAFTDRIGAAMALLRSPTARALNTLPVRLDQWQPTLEAFTDPSRIKIARATEANLAAAQLNPGQATYAAMALSQLGQIDAAFDVINGLLLSKGPLVADRPIIPRSFAANSASWCRTHWLFMPPLAAVRRDLRFNGICDELGLSRYWRQRGVGPDLRIPASAS